VVNFKQITDDESAKRLANKKRITATDVVASLDRAKRVYREQLKSLYDLVDSIEAKKTTVIFKLNVPAAGSGVVKKLTEPMYGILALKTDGSIDLLKTSGPYFVASSTDKEIKLAANPHWYKAQPGMAEVISVRQPPKGVDPQNSFLQDDWVNLLTSSSLTPESLNQKYKSAHFSIWNRNLDKIFFLAPGPRLTNAEGRRFVQLLNQKMNRKSLTKGMSGFTLSDQFFLSGYVLFDPEFHKTLAEGTIPETFKSRPLEIFGIDSRLSQSLRENLKEAIKEVTGHTPHLTTVSAGEADKIRSAGKFDLWAGALPVNDANVEGALGYIFGFDPPFIPNAGENGQDNFHARVLSAKKLSDQSERNLEYRKIFSDAINNGCVLPLFHFSTVGIAKNGMDLSMVPTSDETVTFSKVRFK
jgi:MarR-like DNA-binding transcriptional regulator SgrR of sgrS sRNA